jgi:hypothetical protein
VALAETVTVLALPVFPVKGVACSQAPPLVETLKFVTTGELTVNVCEGSNPLPGAVLNVSVVGFTVNCDVPEFTVRFTVMVAGVPPPDGDSVTVPW